VTDITSAEHSAEHAAEIHIVVNGERKAETRHVLTHHEVVEIAFPHHDRETIYSVSFEKAKHPKEGELVAGQKVEIKNGTEFDVTPTGKS
jgi:hypothetical protein